MVKEAINAVKKGSKDTSLDEAARTTLSNVAKIAQKKYLALKEQIKMEEDKKKAAIEMQREKEQELEDKRNT